MSFYPSVSFYTYLPYLCINRMHKKGLRFHLLKVYSWMDINLLNTFCLYYSTIKNVYNIKHKIHHSGLVSLSNHEQKQFNTLECAR